MYIVREIAEDGSRKEHKCASYEDARALLVKMAGEDKASHTLSLIHI